MKEALRGTRFSSIEEDIGATKKLFFSDGIKRKFVKRWNRCVESRGGLR
jgi:hypothetical protein